MPAVADGCGTLTTCGLGVGLIDVTFTGGAGRTGSGTLTRFGPPKFGSGRASFIGCVGVRWPQPVAVNRARPRIESAGREQDLRSDIAILGLCVEGKASGGTDPSVNPDTQCVRVVFTTLVSNTQGHFQ